ncbi:hypothetical protein [Methylobacterium brachiatum]|uniref:hypothetical protein n=1 Tax=Methylobacterium brachiatum TaxID=269660 RepID=UPI000EFB00DD|nr:hypothetical protein [Methylobacterium brachiatum]AYO85342.1 hypothetical protein EBB05_26035 [Methylobacterium brachiatum]
MRTGAEHTAADADRALRHAQRDPAAQAYGDHLRRKGQLGGPARLPDESPYDEARAGEFEVRRAMALRNARPC